MAIRVLHVDDDSGLLDLAAAFLERHGLSVSTATSAAEGLELLAAEPIDCVVSDYQMPGRDGLEFLAAVRERYPEMPFVLFTGEGSETVASDAIAAGVTDYIRKEATTSQYEVLANRIERAVGERRTASRLAGRERMLRSLVDNLPGVLYRVRADDGTMEVLTGQVRELTGRPASAFLDRGLSWLDVVHEDDTERLESVVQAALRAEEPFEMTYRIRTPEGITRVTNYGRGVPLDGEADAIEGFVIALSEGVGEDTQVRALHEETRRLVGADGPEEIAELVVEAAKHVLGYPINGVRLHDESAGTLVPAAVTEETVERLGERDVYGADSEDGYPALAFASGEPLVVEDVRADERVEGSDGRLRSGMYLPLGRHGTLSIGSDEPDAFGEIDRRLAGILAENARVALDRAVRVRELSDECDRLAALFENIPDPTVRVRFVDGEPIVEAANSAFEETFGYEETALVGHSLDDFIVPDDRDREADRYNERIQSGERLHGEVQRVTADGVREFLIHVVPQSLGDRTTMGYAIYTDITERKHRERELERQNERLDEFASVVSHDLRNPLNIAEGQLQLARDTGEAEHFELVERAHERMRALIDGLLELARQGRTVGDLAAVPLSEAVEVTWGGVDADRLELVVEDLPAVMADRDRLCQLLGNLFSNVAEHAGDGPVTVTVGPLEDGFFVADDGVGIPPGTRESVFESGVSGDETGTGFGLAIVRSIAEAHGWTVAVTEGPDGGACFEFTGVEVVD